jgi:nicotinate-nucleotide adenylyltransferase
MTGLLGGAFDPPHNGHLALARGALDQLDLEHLMVLVNDDPGHKEVVSPAEARLELARAAFGGLPATVVELDRHPRTVDLLREERWERPIFLVGADQFAEFLEWKEPEEVLQRAWLGVATRPGYPAAQLREVLARLTHPERVRFFEIPPVDVSSSEVRRRAVAGEPIDGLVPDAVARLVCELGLYRS